MPSVEQRLILSAQERTLLDSPEKEGCQPAADDQTPRSVSPINGESQAPTSTGMRYRLVWDPLPERRMPFRASRSRASAC